MMKTCPQCSAPYPDEYAVCPRDGTRLSGSGTWEPDSTIRAKYKIVAKIGEGGMATVYKAHHQLLDEVRALKVIKAELARDEQFVLRFKNEAINTRKLQHPNAVRVDDLDIAEDGRPFMAMELVEGESLKNLMLRSGPMGNAEVMDVALQVTEALHAAHALGLVHRDIKPDNIVLVPRGGAAPLVKILDFGIARLKETAPGAAGMTLTGTGVVIGTPDYMSPEQAMGKRGEEVDGRSDLYSLGIVMYRMLTGELPFQADTTVEMIMHHIQTPPKPPQALKPELHIPDAVSAIVMKALEKNREQRFASAASMAEVIRKAREDFTMVTRTPGLPATRTQVVTPAVRPAAPAPPPQANLGARSAIPSPAAPPRPAVRPVRAVPSPPPPLPKPFLSRRALWAALAVLVAFGWVLAARRHKPEQPQSDSKLQATAPAPDPATTATSGPVTAPSAPSPEPQLAAAPSALKVSSPRRRAARVARPQNLKASQYAEPAAEYPSAETGQSPQPSPAEQKPSRPAKQNQPAMVQQYQPVPGAGMPRQGVRQINDSATQFFQAGEYRRAARLFMQALNIDPNNKRAQTGLEKCREMIRQTGQGGQWQQGQSARRQRLNRP